MARDATEARHYQAIWLWAQGRTLLAVAEVLVFVPRWVDELAQRYNAFGPGALDDQRRRSSRTEALLARIRALLRRTGGMGARGGLSFLDLTLDQDAHRVTRNGRVLHLARRSTGCWNS